MPPHRGHKFLIDTALHQADNVTVMVCRQPSDPIPAELRAAWLQEIHPTAHVRVIDDIGDDDNSKAWAEYSIQLLGHAPEAVFTSENYGHDYAKFMKSKHVFVDKERIHVPISGTLARQHPRVYWEYLEPPVRAYFAARICILGAESTGTTTLSQDLAEHYRTNWVPEYGREYSEIKMHRGDFQTWRTNEFVDIATEQGRREDLAARESNRVLICDTDPFATSVWHERYLGQRSPEVEQVSQHRSYPLYILTGDEIPFVQDGLRDGEHIRHWMHGRFIERLREAHKNFMIVTGPRADRLRSAVAAIDPLLYAPTPKV